jgi:hypothetical protein
MYDISTTPVSREATPYLLNKIEKILHDIGVLQAMLKRGEKASETNDPTYCFHASLYAQRVQCRLQQHPHDVTHDREHLMRWHRAQRNGVRRWRVKLYNKHIRKGKPNSRKLTLRGATHEFQ